MENNPYEPTDLSSRSTVVGNRSGSKIAFVCCYSGIASITGLLLGCFFYNYYNIFDSRYVNRTAIRNTEILAAFITIPAFYLQGITLLSALLCFTRDLKNNPKAMRHFKIGMYTLGACVVFWFLFAVVTAFIRRFA